MKQEIRNRVLMLDDAITAEVPASRTDRRAWMMIRPNDSGGVMLVRFEHHESLDLEGWAGPEDILDRTREDFGTLDEAIAAVVSSGIDPDTFDAPWKMDYPL